MQILNKYSAKLKNISKRITLIQIIKWEDPKNENLIKNIFDTFDTIYILYFNVSGEF